MIPVIKTELRFLVNPLQIIIYLITWIAKFIEVAIATKY